MCGRFVCEYVEWRSSSHISRTKTAGVCITTRTVTTEIPMTSPRNPQNFLLREKGLFRKKELDLYFKVLRSFWAFCTVLVFYHYCVNHYLSDFQLRLLQTLSDYFRCGQGEGTKNLGSTREQKITNTEHYCETLIKVGHFLHHPY